MDNTLSQRKIKIRARKKIKGDAMCDVMMKRKGTHPSPLITVIIYCLDQLSNTGSPIYTHKTTGECLLIVSNNNRLAPHILNSLSC